MLGITLYFGEGSMFHGHGLGVEQLACRNNIVLSIECIVGECMVGSV